MKRELAKDYRDLRLAGAAKVRSEAERLWRVSSRLRARARELQVQSMALRAENEAIRFSMAQH